MTTTTHSTPLHSTPQAVKTRGCEVSSQFFIRKGELGSPGLEYQRGHLSCLSLSCALHTKQVGQLAPVHRGFMLAHWLGQGRRRVIAQGNRPCALCSSEDSIHELFKILRLLRTGCYCWGTCVLRAGTQTSACVQGKHPGKPCLPEYS